MRLGDIKRLFQRGIAGGDHGELYGALQSFIAAADAVTAAAKEVAQTAVVVRRHFGAGDTGGGDKRGARSKVVKYPCLADDCPGHTGAYADEDCD